MTCLSTSKWVHLNFGDEGIRRLFSRVLACLRPVSPRPPNPSPDRTHARARRSPAPSPWPPPRHGRPSPAWQGGRFILEPQPWSSYRKRSGLTPEIQRTFRSIEMRPTAFVEYLLSEAGGFAACETVEVAYADGHSDGFKRRPLLLLTKGV